MMFGAVAVECPQCGAPVGVKCMTRTGKPLSARYCFHKIRGEELPPESAHIKYRDSFKNTRGFMWRNGKLIRSRRAA